MLAALPKKREIHYNLYPSKKKLKKRTRNIEREWAFQRPMFFSHFQRLLSMEPVSMMNIEWDTLQLATPFVLLDYSDTEAPCLSEFFRENRHPSVIVEAYQYFLKGLCLLEQEEIVHTNITENTLLCDFRSHRFLFSQNGDCFLYKELITTYQDRSSKKGDCIDLFVLVFLRRQCLSSLSLANLNDIWDGWMAFVGWKENLEEWKKDWLFQMHRYINAPLNVIVDGLFANAGVWNVYSLQFAFFQCLRLYEDRFYSTFSRWLLSQMGPFEKKLPNAALKALDHFIDGYY